MAPNIASHSLFHVVTGRATVPHYSNFVTADFISRHCKGTTLYTKETPTQVGSLKNLLKSQNSYEIQTRSQRAGRNKEMERYPQNLGSI
jgi:hypothetical protein